MTAPELCMMAIYTCDLDGTAERLHTITFDDLPEYLSDYLEVYDFYMGDWIISPDTWPIADYPFCICGCSVLNTPHLVLQWGDADGNIDDDYWAEWQLALHEECFLEFIEDITGGTIFEGYEDYMAWRDEYC